MKRIDDLAKQLDSRYARLMAMLIACTSILVTALGAASAAHWGEFGRWWWDGGTVERGTDGQRAWAVGPRRGVVARLERIVVRQFEGGHIPIGPPEPDFC